MLFFSLGLMSFFGLSYKKYMWVFFYSFFFLLYYMKFLFMTGDSFFSGQFMFFNFDSVSLFFLYLSVWVCLFSFLPMMYSENKSSFFLFLLIMTVLVFLFTTNNIFMFFLTFELSLIPIIFLITSWGSYKERIFSAYYFLMFTMITSIPLLILMGLMVYLGFSNYLNSFFLISMGGGVNNIPWFLKILVLMGFMSKLPIYGLHIWLPKAHVDAPVGASMILAGVLLKLGGYGLMRIFFIMSFMGLSFFFVLLGVLGYFFTAVICMRQVDMKILVAYSSVNHMSLAFSGIFSYYYLGFKGSFFMFFGHGIVSPMMFFFVHFMVFRSMTRLMHGNKGYFSMYSTIMYFMFIFFIINLGVPPFINFFGEFGIFSSLFFFNNYFFFFILYGFMMSGVYVYNFFTTSTQGKPNWGFSSLSIYFNEIFICMISLVGILLSSLFLDTIM
uniref:NADH-ubiquinone oxidoreductase chain 4 n=1 Tax=Clavelina oblonga TaxID=286222 RepID=A0A024FSQ7_9ASCI|nr:NADH dehydrogenase subunit 4 [Clavelina oblonga]CAL24387.1 NADH dehydrogenase subunit 4 [Clavelina oblonga]